MKKAMFCLLIIVLMALFVATAMATSITSVASGNWNSAATWSPAQEPVAGDNVIITGGYTVTVTATAACATLTFSQTTANNSVVINNTKTLTVSGVVTIINATGGHLNLLTVGSGSTLNAGSIAFTSGSGTKGHEITISTGTVTVTGDITATGASGSATITFTSSGTLKISGQLCQFGYGTLNAASNSTVEYNGTDQNVQGYTYGNLVLSNSGTKSFVDNPYLYGNMTLSGTVNANIISNLTIAGNLNIGNGTTCTITNHNIAVSGTTTVGGGTSGTLAITSYTGTKAFTGLVTIAANGVWNNSGSSAVTFRGGITNNGTFTAGSGTHTFSTNAQALTGTFSIDYITSDVTLTNNNTLTVNGSLSGTGGLTNPNGSTLNIGGGALIATLTADVYQNTVNYTGAASQTIKATTYYALTVNQSGGLGATLGGSTTVNYMLTMTKGNIALGGYTLTLGTPLNAYGTLTYTTGNYLTGSGTFTRYFQASGQIIPASFTGDYGRFPMGYGSNDRTVLVDFPWGGIMNTGTISVSHATATGATTVTGFSDGALTINKRSNMSWTIAQSGLDLGEGHTMGIQITAGFIGGVYDLADIALTRGSSIAGGSRVGATGSTDVPIMARTGMSLIDIANTFYVGATNNSPLPVELTSFTVSAKEQSVVLYWSTATEVNNYGFEVERKAVENWDRIGFVKGAGTGNVPHEYNYTDVHVAPGRYAYRLKQIDNDGTYKYTSQAEVTLSVPKVFALNQNYPNPFNPSTTIEFTLAEDGFTTLKVYDILGKEVETLANGNLKAGVLHQATFNSSELSSGMYFYRLECGKQTQVKKLLLMK